MGLCVVCDCMLVITDITADDVLLLLLIFIILSRPPLYLAGTINFFPTPINEDKRCRIVYLQRHPRNIITLDENYALSTLQPPIEMIKRYADNISNNTCVTQNGTIY